MGRTIISENNATDTAQVALLSPRAAAAAYAHQSAAAGSMFDQHTGDNSTEECNNTTAHDSTHLENTKSNAENTKSNVESTKQEYLANIAVSELRTRHLHTLPLTASGAEFVTQHGTHGDSVTHIIPDQRYSIRDAAAHPVEECFRARLFRQVLCVLCMYVVYTCCVYMLCVYVVCVCHLQMCHVYARFPHTPTTPPPHPHHNPSCCSMVPMIRNHVNCWENSCFRVMRVMED